MDRWMDFTESAYSSLLALAKTEYRFIFYNEELGNEATVLWRHDVDFSVHRALRLAEIEKCYDVKSTYFIQLNSSFYNLFESDVRNRVTSIIKCGHQIGLHFDPASYRGMDSEFVLGKMVWQKMILENLFDSEVHAVSFHNPELDDWLSVDSHILCGMVNAYSRFFKDSFGYCSDSNGYWRFDSLESVLRSKRYPRLQVLTHPELWTPEPLSPRRRILRAAEGRARSCMEEYDKILAESGRKNIEY